MRDRFFGYYALSVVICFLLSYLFGCSSAKNRINPVKPEALPDSMQVITTHIDGTQSTEWVTMPEPTPGTEDRRPHVREETQ